LALPSLLLTIEESGVSTWLRESESPFAFYFVLLFHTFGLALLVGANAVIDLRPNEQITLEAELTDGAGQRWQSQAEFMADPQGTVEVSKNKRRWRAPTVSCRPWAWSGR